MATAATLAAAARGDGACPGQRRDHDDRGRRRWMNREEEERRRRRRRPTMFGDGEAKGGRGSLQTVEEPERRVMVAGVEKQGSGGGARWGGRQWRLTATEAGRRRGRAAWMRTVGGGRREERLWQGGTVVPIEKERAGGWPRSAARKEPTRRALRRWLGRWSEMEGQREKAVVAGESTTTGRKKAVLAMEAVAMNEDGDGFIGVEGEVKRERREGRVEAAAVLAMFDDGGEGRGGRGGEVSAVGGVRRPEGRSRERGREEGRWREAQSEMGTEEGRWSSEGGSRWLRRWP